jgi:protein-S-isoprenylcysteine O-methyltransferase Ste14
VNISSGHIIVPKYSLDGASSRRQILPWLVHFIPITYFAALAIWELYSIDWQNPVAVLLSGLALAYGGLIIVNYLRRGPDKPLKSGDSFSLGVAVIGANMLIFLSLLPTMNGELESLAAGADLLGISLSLWAMWHLGASFSLGPEARHLVRTGPYKWVRHPLYAAGFIIATGLLVVKLSPASLGLFLGFVLVQGLRMYNEEHVLSLAMPAYRLYKQSTWALVPHII